MELVGCFAELGLELPAATVCLLYAHLSHCRYYAHIHLWQVVSLVSQLGKGSEANVSFDEFCRCVAMFVNMDS